MREKTVKRRIFISQALMILVTLALIAAVNYGLIKVYWEHIEKQWKSTVENMVEEKHADEVTSMEDMLEKWTVHQKAFYMVLFVDVVVCAGVLVLVSLLFTGGLVKQIMRPLDALRQGVGRIRENKLTEPVLYDGEIEFKEICETFNDMQQHILEEQEKNRKYEKARTEMIAGISHDLRTPLTAVQGTIKALMDGIVKDPAQQEKFLKTAYKRTGDMERLLSQLFYLSKLETGNMPLELREVDLQEFLRRYVEGKRELSQDLAIAFTSGENMKNVNVQMDPEQFQRVLDNLVENSRKYAGVENLAIQVTLREENEKYVVSVADNGHGVPEENLPHLFDEFYRGDASRSRTDGNGLGLYIVKSLIEAMKGSVRAENCQGLTVRIELPKGE